MLKAFKLFTALLFSLVLNAQIPQIAESAAFDEPEDGNIKLLQLKNGGTLYYHRDKVITIKLFDDSHKLLVETNLQPTFGLENTGMMSLFEVKGDLAMFFNKIDDRTPKLYRVIVDGKSGKIKDEKQIAELNKIEKKSAFAFNFGDVEPPSFNIVNDPYSDNYALALFNSLEADRAKRIEIVLFDASHKEAARSFYSSPDDKFKYMRYVDMTLVGDDKVAVLANGYNTKKSGGKASATFIATLTKGSDKITLTELKFATDLYLKYGITKYNPITKKVVLLPAFQESESRSMTYIPFLAFFDPYTLALDKNTTLPTPDAVSEKCVEIFGRKAKYVGMPQDLYINNDGSLTIVNEEITYFIPERGYNSTVLGSICVATYSNDGKILSSQYIPKSQWMERWWLDPFYVSGRHQGVQGLGHGNQFKSFSYLNGPTNNYIFFNDVEENAEKIANGKITNIKGVSACDAFYYKLSTKEIMPSRDFVFSKSDNKKEHQLALFATSNYDKKRNLYATLKLVKDGKHQQVKVVWLQP